MDIIDESQMNECMTGDPELDRDLIQSAIDEIQSRIGDLEESLSTQDYEKWRGHAHRSVGAAATLGFKALADQFRAAEHHTNTDEERAAALNAIKEFFELTREELVRFSKLES